MYGTYVFGESWIGVGLGVHWVVCTMNCGGLILRITVLVSCNAEYGWRSYALVVEVVKGFL